MNIRYNITGNERKTLVEAARRLLDTTTKYCGAPSFAYALGDDYRIDREGGLTGPDNRDLVADLESLHSFKAVEETYDTDTEAPAEPEYRSYKAELSDPEYPDRMEIFSAENDEDALRQAHEFCEGEVILLELHEMDEDFNIIRGVEITPSLIAIELPLEGFTPEKIDNLRKMVAGKEGLLKMALGVTALPVQVLEDRISLPWFPCTEDGNTVLAYSQLASAICQTALEKNRVNAQPKEDYPNPRFTMRCWLISIGLSGPEFKLIRKLMTASLPGNGAWSKGANPRKADKTEAAEIESAGDDLPGGEGEDNE